ncbi:MAG: hypothetical protein JXR05_06405 [Flavobacteriaceae bacterium]
MTSLTKVEPTKVLAIYPCTRGFSYAVMENPLKLIEFNLISPKKFDKEKLLDQMKRVINSHKPVTLVLEDCESKYCRKGKRTKNLIKSIFKWAKKEEITVCQYSRDDIRNLFERWNATTKYDIALVLSRNISELQQYIYNKPKYPDREVNIDSLFCSVSLGVTHFYITD